MILTHDIIYSIPPYISYSYHCCGQISDRNNLREEFILDHSFIGLGPWFFGPMCLGRTNCMAVEIHDRGHSSLLGGQKTKERGGD
jgi:hypothetical protein